MTDTHPAFTDEALTAYLDGEADAPLRAQINHALEADAGLRARLQELEFPKELLAQGFAPENLDAPEIPAHLVEPSSSGFSGFVWPAAIAASFALGMVVMQALQPAPQKPGWVDQVASYQSLYVTETLDGAPQPSEVSERVLSEAEDLLGVSLDAALDIQGLEFKRIQVLALGDQPLIQMAYLDEAGVPFAFCLTPLTAEDRGMATKTSWQLAQSSWVESGVGFVLIGGDDEAQVARLSEGLRGRL
ncbi:MAG: hypothetical protein AAF340_12650 [Pseudomonadota bacterium]